jgi:hypothetical protein
LIISTGSSKSDITVNWSMVGFSFRERTPLTRKPRVAFFDRGIMTDSGMAGKVRNTTVVGGQKLDI